MGKIFFKKPILLIYLTLGILIGGISLEVVTPHQTYRQVKATFLSDKGAFSFDAEVAESQAQVILGLMRRPQLGQAKGMLFVFPDVSLRYFWMKNTLIPLDIIFISDTKRIVYIAQQAQPCPQPPCPTYDSQQLAQYVMEINGGLSQELGLKAGDRVEFNLK